MQKSCESSSPGTSDCLLIPPCYIWPVTFPFKIQRSTLNDSGPKANLQVGGVPFLITLWQPAQRNLCSRKNNRCASKNWFPRIDLHFQSTKRCRSICGFFNSFFASFTCKVVKASTSVPGEDLFCFHQRSSCFHWICSDPKWLEPGMESWLPRLVHHISPRKSWRRDPYKLSILGSPHLKSLYWLVAQLVNHIPTQVSTL